MTMGTIYACVYTFARVPCGENESQDTSTQWP